MNLPHADVITVDREKIVEYLLNSTHRYGSSKAQFFTGFGFHVKTWEVLVAALRQHAQMNEVSHVTLTKYGPRYEIDGEIAAPDGRRPQIRTVSQLDEGRLAPRFITAYPLAT